MGEPETFKLYFTIDQIQQWTYDLTGTRIPDWIAAELLEAKRQHRLEYAQDIIFVSWNDGKFWKITPSGLNDPYHIITEEEQS